MVLSVALSILWVRMLPESPESYYLEMANNNCSLVLPSAPAPPPHPGNPQSLRSLLNERRKFLQAQCELPGGEL